MRLQDINGCFVTKEYSEITVKGNVEAILSYFLSACKCPDFTALCANAGFSNPSFQPNDELRAGNPSHDKFQVALQRLEHQVCFGVAFHGTPTTNITSILRQGLDPKKRRGQAYGPGEYFGKEPGISVYYCKGGLEMLVFVVVLPSTLSTHKKTLYTQSDFLVVENNKHQLPIGTMKFTSVDPAVLRGSQEKRRQLLALSKEVFDKSRIAEEGRMKAQIIQNLITMKVDIASEQFEKQKSFLKQTSKREIAWYVQKTVDKELVSYYFPDLPDPLSPDEFNTAGIQSVDDAMMDLCNAVQKLENEKPGTWTMG